MNCLMTVSNGMKLCPVGDMRLSMRGKRCPNPQSRMTPAIFFCPAPLHVQTTHHDLLLYGVRITARESYLICISIETFVKVCYQQQVKQISPSHHALHDSVLDGCELIIAPACAFRVRLCDVMCRLHGRLGAKLS